MDTLTLWQMIASATVGLALAFLAWHLISIVTQPRVIDPELGRFEETRREELRSLSRTYRLFEPWIDEIVESNGGRRPDAEEKLQQDLTTAAEPAAWKAAEYQAVWQVQAILAAIGGAVFGWFFSGELFALACGVGGFFFYRWLMRRNIRKRAAKRRRAVKRHLASAIDLLALMMEVGGNFQESLATVAQRARGTPLGEELGRVLVDIQSGRPRKEALQGLATRLRDEDADEFVFAVVQGEELGSPLATILRNQADQMRQKRSQWAEKASEEAQVMLVFPAVLIMIGCLVIVAAPFVLNAMFSADGTGF